MTQVIRFHAEWCGPCRAYAPTWNKVVSESIEPEVEFLEINVDKDTSGLAAEYKIMSLPTTVVVKEGKIVAKKTGGLSENELKVLIFN
jgi:thiol-disulfide isomerase/thioredoxin